MNTEDEEKQAYYAIALNGLVDDIHETAVEHGWWDCETCEGEGHLGETFGRKLVPAGDSELNPDEDYCCVGHPCPTCKGSGKHRNPAELIALQHSELSEALEALREPELDGRCDKCENNTIRSTDEASQHYCRKCDGTGDALGGSRFAEEQADALIRILDTCGGLGIDIASAVIQKMAFNRTRPRKHGKKF